MDEDFLTAVVQAWWLGRTLEATEVPDKVQQPR